VDRKKTTLKTALYFSIPVKLLFKIDSKQLIKIQFYSPQNDLKSISVIQYSSRAGGWLRSRDAESTTKFGWPMSRG
jgi:hypothetical protein